MLNLLPPVTGAGAGAGELLLVAGLGFDSVLAIGLGDAVAFGADFDDGVALADEEGAGCEAEEVLGVWGLHRLEFRRRVGGC